MNSVDDIYNTSKNFEHYAASYLKYLSSLLKRVDLKKLSTFAQMIKSMRQDNKKMIFCGNGGSASTASHFVNDFTIGTRSPHMPFKAISLTDNNAVITAIGNDFGFDNIFKIQLESLLEDGDILVVISASGNSNNLIKAVEHAKANGNATVGLLGFDGGKLRSMVALDIIIESANGDYGPVEDSHLIINHLIMNFFLRMARDEVKNNE